MVKIGTRHRPLLYGGRFAMGAAGTWPSAEMGKSGKTLGQPAVEPGEGQMGNVGQIFSGILLKGGQI